jgi:hypothetical protein
VQVQLVELVEEPQELQALTEESTIPEDLLVIIHLIFYFHTKLVVRLQQRVVMVETVELVVLVVHQEVLQTVLRLLEVQVQLVELVEQFLLEVWLEEMVWLRSLLQSQVHMQQQVSLHLVETVVMEELEVTVEMDRLVQTILEVLVVPVVPVELVQ